MEKKVLDLSIIGRNKLCCIICSINPLDVQNSISKSIYHFQILKCRLLMASMENYFIIASPMPRNPKSFYVITTHDFYKTKILQKIMGEQNLMASEPQPVTPQAYISCLKYTIDFYLAPNWNKVNNSYFEGKEFWATKEVHHVIKYNIRLMSKEGALNDQIHMECTPLKAKLFPVKLHDLCIPHSVIADFEAGGSETINVSLFGTQRVSIIPSMRKGRVLYITKKIPANCPFKNWEDMRRHWKNMYGYRLPKTEEGIIFYQIYFPMTNYGSKTNIFIYPGLCVRQDLSEFICTACNNVVIELFTKDFEQIMPKIGASIEQVPKEAKDQETPTPINGNNEENGKVNENMAKTNQTESDDHVQNRTDLVEPSENILNNIAETERASRLSTSASERIDHRQVTTPMSPTPSIMGKRTVSPKKPLNFDNLRKVNDIHDRNTFQRYKSSATVNDQSQYTSFNIFRKPTPSSLSSSIFLHGFPPQSQGSNTTNMFFNPPGIQRFSLQSQNNNNSQIPGFRFSSQLNSMKRNKPVIIDEEIITKENIVLKKSKFF